MTEEWVAGRPRPACPACGWLRYKQLKVGAGVLVQREGALLLIQRSNESGAFPGSWNLPAGYCEADEPPPVTAAREAAEKTGLQVEVGPLVDVYFFDDDPLGNGLLLVYEAEVVGGELLSDGRVVTAGGFFRVDQLPQPLGGGGHDQAILAWRARALDRWQPGLPIRYCPHCKHAVEERQVFDRLRPVCPACGFVHFRDPKIGVTAWIEEGRRVLLVRRAIEPGEGQWCLPSGFVEWDESPEVAAARECAEETGLVPAGLELLDVSHYTDDSRGPGINLTYRVWVAGGSLEPGDDAAEVRFFAAYELPPTEAIAFRSHRVLLERWQEAHSGASLNG